MSVINGVRHTLTPFQESYIEGLSRRSRIPWRRTSFIIVQHANGLFGTGLQNTKDKEWGPPQGGVDDGDADGEAAAKREALEEIGLHMDSVELFVPDMYRGKLKGSRDPWVIVGAHYIGYLMKLKDGVEIDLAQATDPKKPILDWKWDTLEGTCRTLTEQPDVRTSSKRLKRIKQKGVDIFCPALRNAAAVLEEYKMLSRLK